ncbi:odorant receptor 82a-like [Pogonomyrmex barbatus]|uniref:Odorant receptor n=1 Tax=Pogonomyrmex barbatus TaxID=144034 RepID=A0A8N1S741_9HYME|nr:odorant receptor 82a-like [Pogonomyrmex barbatus]
MRNLANFVRYFSMFHDYCNEQSSEATIDMTVLRYRVYTRRVRRMLYLGGILQDRKRSAICSYITGLLIIFTCFGQCIFTINFCRDHTDNLVLLSRSFGLTCSLIAPVLMSICFLVKREKLMNLHETLNGIFERELTRNRETEETILATLHTFDRPSYILCFTLGSTVLLILCPPLVSTVRQIIYHTESKRYRLPLPAKFPWSISIDGNFSFYLSFLYQIFICWWMVFTVGSVDSLFGYYAFQISSILQAMSFRLANPRPREVFAEVLRTCVQTHHRLLRCGHMLNDIWDLIIIRMILTNAILMCVLIFEASPFTHLTIGQILLFVSYMALKLLQTFIYAWYGNLVTNASEHFRQGIYFSEWSNSNLNHHIRTSIIITMMQKPMIIKALKLSSVNVNMFTNIVNTAMSYFFLLQSLDQNR